MKKWEKKSFTFAGMLVFLFVLYGCTGDSSPLGDGTDEEVSASNTGITECFGCHADNANPAGLTNVVGDSDVSKSSGWLWGPHGNNETLDMVTYEVKDLSPDNKGFPYYGYSGLGEDPECTTQCHDQLGDGRLLDEYYGETGDAALGRVERPIVGCESCHGPGAGHFGIGPIANATPGPDRCGQCHNETFDHNQYHPEGDEIYENYLASPHSNSIENSTGVTSGSPDIQAACSRCHTDEGAREYAGVINGTESRGVINSTLGGMSDIADASNVQCRTCHDPHNPLRLLGETVQGLPASWSAEFKTCTACHQLYDVNSVPITAYHDPAAPDGDMALIINDTHYDDPATVEIEGYILNTSTVHSPSPGNTNGGTCRDCHNPHSADTSKNSQWARSAHGGFINTNGVVSEAEAAAWVHYDFKADNRDACQRCHTATGFRNLANDPAAYDADKDGHPDTPNVFTATGEQREMLYCWACHTSNRGDLRNPGVFNGTSPYAEPAGRIASVPDLKGSNICMSCHSGRSSGAVIAATSPAIFNNTSFKNSHYLAAGGTLYRTAGYEYGGDYENETFFQHDDIGVPDGNGPCVECHMGSAEGHTLEPVEKVSGVVTDITSYDNTCSTCHGDTASDKAMLVDRLNSCGAGFADALLALESTLAARGIYFYPSYPYFFTAPYNEAYTESGLCSENLPVKNWQTGGTSTYAWNGSSCVSSVAVEGAAGTGPDNMGAAFNFNLLHHEPGAHVHNQLYAKRLIYDSLDHLDDGALNESVSLASPAYEWMGGTGTPGPVSRP